MSTINTINKEFLSFFKDHKIDLKSRFLIGVSGGNDSMAVLNLAVESKLEVSVAHINYQLRDEESERDYKIVEEYCKINNLNFYYKKVKLDSLKNLQNKAREIRYKYYNEIISQENLDYIITGHHQNDDHETFLLNTIKGGGIKGLKGIPEKNGIILRPALQFTKSRLLEYVQHHKIKIGIDSSNLVSKYERNYLRNEVFNKISSKFPDFEKGFTNSIQFLKKDYLLLNELVQKVINPQIEERRNYLIINFDNSIPKQAWYHFFKRFGFNFSQVNNWVVNNSQSGKHIESLTHKLSVDRNKWILSKRNFKKLNNEIFEVFKNQKIKTPILLEGHLTEKCVYEKSKKVEYFDYSNLVFPLKLRKWKSGDRIQPLGMKGNKKVSDILIDQKISMLEKDNIYVLFSNNDIIWIVGIIISEKYKIDKSSKTFYKFNTE